MNVAVLDQQLTFADTVATRLLTQEDVQRATAHTSVETQMALLRAEPVNVVLVDWELCDTGSGALVPQLCDEHRDLAFLVTATHSSPGEIVSALQAGALGWVPKDMPFQALLTGLRCAARGERWIPSDLLTSVLTSMSTRAENGNGSPGALSSLTRREREVLQGMVDGLHRSQIAEELGMSPNTVRTHVQSVLQKLDVHSSLRAVAIARQAGLAARVPLVPEQRSGHGSRPGRG
jgi:DNA-binding NarL/FixJ family response regulator